MSDRTTFVFSGEVSHTEVCLRFSGDDLDPDVISDTLMCRPDEGTRRGGRRLTPRGTETVAQTGVWRKQLAKSTPGNLDRKIDELLACMTNDLDLWRQLTAKYKADMFCGIFMDEFNQGLTITPATLSAIGSRGLTLSLDLYGSEAVKTLEGK